jgi:predicted house-cleaning noncanonical NTP pyrophosphatase (MazG superfamily)
MAMFNKTLYTTTVKYFRLSLKEFIPYVEKLKEFSSSENSSELEDILEMYLDIVAKIV